jgi:hypothetical protein
VKLNDILNKIDLALIKLQENDHYIIKNRGNERSITHRLAVYIEELFPNYHVDCEYNLNCESKTNKKEIALFDEEIKKYKPKKKRKIKDELEERVNVSVFPDIIVHRRGKSKNNLLIIEIKKSDSHISCEYDYLKLQKYTDKNNRIGLHYQFGVFIEIDVEFLNKSIFHRGIFINGIKSKMK